MKKGIILLAVLAIVSTVCTACAGKKNDVKVKDSMITNEETASITESTADTLESIDIADAAIIEQPDTAQTNIKQTGNTEEIPTENAAFNSEVSEKIPENDETAIQKDMIPETTTAETHQETDELCVGQAKEIFEATNAERVAAGLPELIWSDELAEAADIRAEEIINNFDHVRPDGTKCYVLSSLIHGENIARGPHASGQEYVSGWMGSEGHRANILCEQYTLIGVGTRYTEYGDTAVQIFGFYD